ncbi:MAG: BLUF domain-containing protein [Pseudomonadota bacterium]
MLTGLVYISRPVFVLSDDAIATILRGCRAANAKIGITGFLYYDTRQFLQALEGEPSAVETLVGRIARDPRHRAVRVLSRGQRLMRLCPGEPLKAIDGRRRLQRTGIDYTTLAEADPPTLQTRIATLARS